MKLSRPVKALVGASTLIVLFLPFALMAVFFAGLLPTIMAEEVPSTPPPFFTGAFAVVFPAMCLFTFVQYGLIAFYLTHIVKTPEGSDVLRIILAIAIFLFPMLGMPAYFLIFVWPDSVPQWALNRLAPSNPL